MKQVIIAGVIILFLFIFNSYFQYTEYRDRKNHIINQHVEMEMYIVRGIARSASRWFSHGIVDLGRRKERVEGEVFKYFVEPVLLYKNGDAWIYNRDYVIFDKSSDFPDIYRGKSIKQIFEMQEKSGAYHYDELVNGVLNATEGTAWYVWLPDKGKEWAAWTSIRIGDDTWTIGLSTPENEILKYNGMNDYRNRIIINSTVISILLLIVFIAVLRMKMNDIRNQNELCKARKSAEDANMAKTRFLANISHEIRTPINGIIGMTFMLSQTEPGESQREYIGLIESSTDYLMETIDQLLDISKIESGKFIIQEENFNLQAILDLSVRIFSVSAKNKNLDFVYEPGIDQDVKYVYGDKKILRLILNNLLGNAVKYTERGQVGLAVKTESAPGGTVRLTLTVSDTGIGSQKQFRDKIFDYFYQVN
jgi:signal transduction histidine kinase